MRNKELNERLRALAGQASVRLASDIEAGAEIPFEVAEKPGSRSVLYHYSPLSAQFVRERLPVLRDLPGYAPAVEALAAVEGCSAYLRVLGASYVPASQRDRAEAVLREFLARVWDDSTTLEFESPRFDRAYIELESIVFEDTVINTVVAPLIGVALAAERWELGSGLALVRGDLSDAPPEAVWASGREDEEPNTILILTAEARPEESAPLTEARMCFRKLLSAVRLLKPGAASLGASAWWRSDTGPWQSVPLGFAGRSRGNPYVLESDERSELMEIFELLRLGRAMRGSLSWALSRFELGCEQPVALDGLSDYLLAARALLDAGEPPAVGVALRLAALCAEPADQRSVQMRTEAAFKLERLVMRGDVGLRLPRLERGLDRRKRSCATWKPTCARCCATQSAGTCPRTCARSPTRSSPSQRPMPATRRARAGARRAASPRAAPRADEPTPEARAARARGQSGTSAEARPTTAAGSSKRQSAKPTDTGTPSERTLAPRHLPTTRRTWTRDLKPRRSPAALCRSFADANR